MTLSEFKEIQKEYQKINIAIKSQIINRRCEIADLFKSINRIIDLALLIEGSSSAEDSEEQQMKLQTINSDLKTFIVKLLNLLIKQKAEVYYNEISAMLDVTGASSSEPLMKRKVFHEIIRLQDIDDEEQKALTTNNTTVNAIKTEATPEMVMDKSILSKNIQIIIKMTNATSLNLRKIVSDIDNTPHSLSSTTLEIYLNSNAKQMLNEVFDDAEYKLKVILFDLMISQKRQKLNTLLSVIKEKKEFCANECDHISALEALNASVANIIADIAKAQIRKNTIPVFTAAFQSLKESATILQQAISTEQALLPPPSILNPNIQIDSQQNEIVYVPTLGSQTYDPIDQDYVPPSGSIFRQPSIGAGSLLGKRKYSPGMFSSGSSASDDISLSNDEEDTDNTDLTSAPTSGKGCGK